MDPLVTPEPRSTTPIPVALPPRPDKRALLLIYIHGFKGSETSFKEFPTVLLPFLLFLFQLSINAE